MSATVVTFEEKYLPEVTEIFFESSTRKTFKDEEEKARFFEKYVGFYLRHFPQLAIVAIDQGRVMGYVVAAPETSGAELDALQPHLRVFKDSFKDYPSHLHINCHFESRGKGIGSLLMGEIERRLKALKVHGLHIMTGPGAANKNFYSRLGFDFETKLDFHGSPILLMGKKL